MIFLDYLVEFLFVWVVSRFKAWRRHRLVIHVQNWPQASGRGLEAHAECSDDSSHPICAAQITYVYMVNGEYFSGYVSFARRWQEARGRVSSRMERPWNSRTLLAQWTYWIDITAGRPEPAVDIDFKRL